MNTTAKGLLTIAVLSVLLIAAIVIGFTLMLQPAPPLRADAPGDDETCTMRTIKGGQLGANKITVNVYNASNQAGLADETMSALVKQGFLRGGVGNRSNYKRGGVTLIARDPSLAPVTLVKRQFSGSVKVVKGKGNPLSIDVILGRKYRGTKSDAPTTIKSDQPIRECI